MSEKSTIDEKLNALSQEGIDPIGSIRMKSKEEILGLKEKMHPYGLY